MIERANNRGDKEVYFNTANVIDIQQMKDDLYNVYLIGNKAVQINGETLRRIIRG